MILLATTLILSAACVSRADQDSRTAASSSASADSRAQAPARRVPVREHCPATVKAITYYRRSYTASRTAMGLAGAVPRVWYQQCPAIRRRAVEWRSRARKAARELAAWKREWAAPPEPFLSIARCEQGSDTGLHGVEWDAYSLTYEGAYGFLHSTWDDFRPAGFPDNAANATPRQQTVVARRLVATFGGYSSWPACHIRLGLPG